MSYLIAGVFILFIAQSLVSCKSCKQYQAKYIGITVENPEEGSPEKVIQDAMKAALDPNEEEGFTKFKALLHTDETEIPNRVTHYNELAFPRFRKQVHQYVKDKDKATFVIKRWDELQEDQLLMIYVEVDPKYSDMPRPIKLKRDKNDGNKWRILDISL
jgi:hypothetical protein